MNKKHFIIHNFYIIIGLVVAAQAITTVYQLSKTIGYGQKMAYLQRQRQEMIQEKNKLQHQRSSQQSLINLSQNSNDYLPITATITVAPNTSLASR